MQTLASQGPYVRPKHQTERVRDSAIHIELDIEGQSSHKMSAVRLPFSSRFHHTYIYICTYVYLCDTSDKVDWTALLLLLNRIYVVVYMILHVPNFDHECRYEEFLLLILIRFSHRAIPILESLFGVISHERLATAVPLVTLHQVTLCVVPF